MIAPHLVWATTFADWYYANVLWTVRWVTEWIYYPGAGTFLPF